MRRGCALGACEKLMVFSSTCVIRLLCALAARFLLKVCTPSCVPGDNVIYELVKIKICGQILLCYPTKYLATGRYK